MNGVDSVRHVLDHFRAQNRNGQYDSVLNGYRGMVFSLLFYFIVNLTGLIFQTTIMKLFRYCDRIVSL